MFNALQVLSGFRVKPGMTMLKKYWMPPYQVRGRLIKPGMTGERIKGDCPHSLDNERDCRGG